MEKLKSKKQYKYPLADDIFLRFFSFLFSLFNDYYYHQAFHFGLFAFLLSCDGKILEKLYIKLIA